MIEKNAKALYLLMYDFLLGVQTTEDLVRFWASYGSLSNELPSDLKDRIIKRKDELKSNIENNEFYHSQLKKGSF